MAPKSENYDKRGGSGHIFNGFVRFSFSNQQTISTSIFFVRMSGSCNFLTSFFVQRACWDFFFLNFSLLKVVTCSVKPLQLACRLFVQISWRRGKYFYGVQINFVAEGFSFNSQRSQQAYVLLELWNFLHLKETYENRQDIVISQVD